MKVLEKGHIYQPDIRTPYGVRGGSGEPSNCAIDQIKPRSLREVRKECDQFWISYQGRWHLAYKSVIDSEFLIFDSIPGRDATEVDNLHARGEAVSKSETTIFPCSALALGSLKEIEFLKRERERLLVVRDAIGGKTSLRDEDLSAMSQVGNRLTEIYWTLHHLENAT